MKVGGVFRHISTGNLYMILHNAISADNATNGKSTVVYRRLHSLGAYTRSAAEFENRFTKVDGDG